MIFLKLKFTESHLDSKPNFSVRIFTIFGDFTVVFLSHDPQRRDSRVSPMPESETEKQPEHGQDTAATEGSVTTATEHHATEEQVTTTPESEGQFLG